MIVKCIRYFKFVNYHLIDDYLKMGWIVYEPEIFDHTHYYGLYMYWICDCKLPQLRKNHESH